MPVARGGGRGSSLRWPGAGVQDVRSGASFAAAAVAVRDDDDDCLLRGSLRKDADRRSDSRFPPPVLPCPRGGAGWANRNNLGPGGVPEDDGTPGVSRLCSLGLNSC